MGVRWWVRPAVLTHPWLDGMVQWSLSLNCRASTKLQGLIGVLRASNSSREDAVSTCQSPVSFIVLSPVIYMHFHPVQ